MTVICSMQACSFYSLPMNALKNQRCVHGRIIFSFLLYFCTIIWFYVIEYAHFVHAFLIAINANWCGRITEERCREITHWQVTSVWTAKGIGYSRGGCYRGLLQYMCKTITDKSREWHPICGYIDRKKESPRNTKVHEKCWKGRSGLQLGYIHCEPIFIHFWKAFTLVQFHSKNNTFPNKIRIHCLKTKFPCWGMWPEHHIQNNTVVLHK